MTFDIPGFEILEKIGQGGMASVWKARQLSLDRIVAIKILSEGFADEPEDVRRFQEEAQAAAKLKHPGMVLVHDANAENGMYYFIMEYVSGYTVGDWVRRKGVLSEKDALLVADCVADALGYAWDHANIVHCDIKPDNVIIDEDGTVKVADLGLSRTISLMEMDVEESDEIMGTPAYISPEQALGETNLDFRADIYSLGAMLYHLVTGKMMFDELDDDETLDMQVNGRVDDPIDLNPSLSKGICWLIERMTAKDPALREDSWDRVRSDINRVRRGLLPKGVALPDDASTVRRSIRRTAADYKRVANIQKIRRSARTPIIRTTIKIAVIAIALAVVLKMYMQQSSVGLDAEVALPAVVTNVVHESESDLEVADSVVVPSVVGNYYPPEVVDMEIVRAKEMYDFAVVWQEEHSDDFAASIEQFNAVVEETRGTKYSLMAQQEIRQLEALRHEAIGAVVVELESQARAFTGGHSRNYGKAISLVRGYDGSYAEETLERRSEIAGLLENERTHWSIAQRQKKKNQNLERQRSIDSLVMAVLSDDLNLSIRLVADMVEAPAFRSVRDELQKVGEVLKKAAGIDEEVLNSFVSQYGETVDVYLERGMRTLTIGRVFGDRVECKQTLSAGRGGVGTISVWVDDLSAYERLKRMGDESQYEVALAKGIMAFQSNASSHAEKYFGMTHPLLKKYLLMKLSGESEENSMPEPPSVAPANKEVVERPLDSSYRKRHFVPDRSRRKRPNHNRFDLFDDEENDLL